MPAPADVQTGNAGPIAGKPESGDSITFTFSGTVPPSLILSGWNGAPTAVTVHFDNKGHNDTVTMRNATTGAQLTAFGSLALEGNYSANADFRNSTMTASGNTVTIVLGTPVGPLKRNTRPAAMGWVTPNGWAAESGPADIDF